MLGYDTQQFLTTCVKSLIGWTSGTAQNDAGAIFKIVRRMQ